jgi:hypothetical protein
VLTQKAAGRPNLESMSEFNYRQRPSTSEYRENWDRMFRSSELPSPNSPESPATTVDGSGLPLNFLCHWCGAAPGEACRGFFGQGPIFGFHALRVDIARRPR